MSTTEQSNPSSSLPLRIGIIGFGLFGQFLAKTMVKQGQIVTATSRSDYSVESASLGVSFYRDIDRFMEGENDVILISTSIISLEDVIRSIPFERVKRRPTLFVDVLSVKEYPRFVLTKELPGEVDLICSHPMFGPESGKNGWNGLAFMYERVRIWNPEICSRFLQMFEQEGCRMLEMSCEEHDRLAARSQFVTHLTGRVLEEMDIQSTSIDTESFRTVLQLRESVAGAGFDLFSGLFVHNRFAKDELKNFEAALGRLKEKLQDPEENKDS